MTELALDHCCRQFGLHGFCVGLQGRERVAVDGAVLAADRQAEVDEGQDLADLHQHALRPRQRVGVSLRVAEVELEARATLPGEPPTEHFGDTAAGRTRRGRNERNRAPHPTLGNRHSHHLTNH